MECFDIGTGEIRYWSSHFLYQALYWRYPILKILTFDIEVLVLDISYPISKIFDIEGSYTILNLFKNNRYWRKNFDIKGLILSCDIEELNFDIEALHTVRYRSFYFDIEGQCTSPTTRHRLSGWRLGTTSVRRGLMRSRNASTVTVRGLFRFTAVRFSVNSSSQAFARSAYKIHFH